MVYCTRFLRLLIALGILLLVASSLPQPAGADDTSLHRSAEGVRPVYEAQVRMVEETVLIKLAEGIVDVTFVFENQGPATDLLVGFPLLPSVENMPYTRWDADEDAESQLGYEDFTVWVDGEEVESWREEGIEPDPSLESDSGGEPEQSGETPLRNGPDWQEDMFYPEWQVFDLHFEAGQRRTVRHTYRTPPHWFQSPWSVEFTYVLRTGANWAGTIGRAEVVVDLAGLDLAQLRGASPDNFTVSDNHITWLFWDFEPEYDIHINYYDACLLRAEAQWLGEESPQSLTNLEEARRLVETGQKAEALAIYRDATEMEGLLAVERAVNLVELGIDWEDWGAVGEGFNYLMDTSSYVHAEYGSLFKKTYDVGGSRSIAAAWASGVVPEDQHPDVSSLIEVGSDDLPTYSEDDASYTVLLPFYVKSSWPYRWVRLWYQVSDADGSVTTWTASDYPTGETATLRESGHGTFEVQVPKDRLRNLLAPVLLGWRVEVETWSGMIYRMDPSTVVLHPKAGLGAISGYVTDLGGNPLTGVVVGLQTQVPGRTIAHEKTNSSGFYRFSDLPSGDYYIWFNTEGYVPAWHGNVPSGDKSRPIAVEAASETTGINIALAPEVKETETTTDTSSDPTDDELSPADDRWSLTALAVLSVLALLCLFLINRHRSA